MMSLPSELRVLCFQLSSIAVSDLPRLIPTLLRHVLRCQIPLSSPAGSAGKADASASASAVLVHKLKTQLSTLLNGKSSEGRFVGVVLIKAVVEVGGWEVLQGSEAWVRGLLALLGKPDSVATKELCIMALTKIFCMTHGYQTLVREITTPALPTFITSCLNLVSSKSSSKPGTIDSSLEEVVFQSFAILLPRHTSIFRPFASQIRLATRAYLAPTFSDGKFARLPLKKSARRLTVLLYQTAPKNTGGEEWSKAVRELVKDIHRTADHVFRAVIEDWESTAGYIAEPVDVNEELHGGGKSKEDLPSWTGIHAGTERLAGLLEFLADHFQSETSTPIAIPLGSLMDITTRMLSISLPSSVASSSIGQARLYPAIDRDERDGLSAGLPQIYVASLQLIDVLAERLQENFLPLVQGTFDQVAWVFQSGKHSPEFRVVAYQVVARTLSQVGQSFDRPQAQRATAIIKSCCQDLVNLDPNFNKPGTVGYTDKKSQGNGSSSNHNADTFLRSTAVAPVDLSAESSDLIIAATALLPLLLSHLPQHYLDISLRSLIERTAILSHNKDAMLSSILNPFVGKNGRALATILPHLAREFPHDSVTEILLRPRMPLLPSRAPGSSQEDFANDDVEDENMQLSIEPLTNRQDPLHKDEPALLSHSNPVVINHPGLGPSESKDYTSTSFEAASAIFSTSLGSKDISSSDTMGIPRQDVTMEDPNDSSEDESVHLTMQLDTDSEDEK